MSKTPVSTSTAPKGSRSLLPGHSCGNLLFTAGQAALDPSTQQLIPGGITEQTRRTLENLKAFLKPLAAVSIALSKPMSISKP